MCEASLLWNQRFMRRSVESRRSWICSWGISFHVVCLQVHKTSQWLLEYHGERVDHQQNSRYFQWATFLANVQARLAVTPVIFQRRLAESSLMWPGGFLLKYGMCNFLKDGQYLGLWNLRNVADWPEQVGSEIGYCIQWRPKISH